MNMIATSSCSMARLSAMTEDKAGELVSLPRLQNKNIDYLALGHLHDYRFERLDSRGHYCYSGALEGRGFDELGPKGFVVVSFNNGRGEP